MADQRLWAPWRMQYVQGERGEAGCIFCLAAEPGDDAARFVMHRSAGCFAMLNAFPYNSGHLMVSPNRHAASLADLDDASPSTSCACSGARSVRCARRTGPTASTSA